jgi:hypothetical protein
MVIVKKIILKRRIKMLKMNIAGTGCIIGNPILYGQHEGATFLKEINSNEDIVKIVKHEILFRVFNKEEKIEVQIHKPIAKKIVKQLQTMGYTNSYFLPIVKEDSLKAREPHHPNNIFGWRFFSRLRIRCSCILLA